MASGGFSEKPRYHLPISPHCPEWQTLKRTLVMNPQWTSYALHCPPCEHPHPHHPRWWYPQLRQRKKEGQTGNLKCRHRPFVGPHYHEPPYKGSSFRGKLRPSRRKHRTGRGNEVGVGLMETCRSTVWRYRLVGLPRLCQPFPKGSLQAHCLPALLLREGGMFIDYTSQ